MPTQLPMFGSMRARVLQTNPVSIHGDIYHDVIVILNESNEQPPVRLRLASHLCQRPPQSGDDLEFTFLMQEVTGARFL